jgi:hypothetical protein
MEFPRGDDWYGQKLSRRSARHAERLCSSDQCCGTFAGKYLLAMQIRLNGE